MNGNQNDIVLIDHQGQTIRLTAERRAHMLKHPEMTDQMERIQETIAAPTLIVAALVDDTVRVYHRFYEQTPVTRKYLQVAVKFLEEDAFVLTAFYSNRPKKGTIVWQT